jgi:hypothetical protein
MTTSTYMLQVEDFLPPTQFCLIFGFPYCTLSTHIHNGNITLHQFPSETRSKIKINVAEALQVMGASPRMKDSHA